MIEQTININCALTVIFFSFFFKREIKLDLKAKVCFPAWEIDKICSISFLMYRPMLWNYVEMDGLEVKWVCIMTKKVC